MSGLLSRLRELSNYRSYAPVLSPRGCERWLSACTDAVQYSGDTRVSFPLPPGQFFGVTYLNDIVLVTEHPVWTMHEFAEVQLSEGRRWICKDSDQRGHQIVSGDLEDLPGWVPEVPVERRYSPVQVEDHSSAERLDLNLQYRTPLDEQVALRFRGKPARRYARLRNGPTFNHSEDIASVVLDIARRQPMGLEVSMSFDGKPARIRKLLGLFPVQAILTQTQCGLVTASMRLTRDGDGYRLQRPIPQTSWPTRADESWTLAHDGDHCTARHQNATSRFELCYERGGLSSAKVWQVHDKRLLMSLRLSAPLPDISRPFEGTVTRRFVIDVNGITMGRGHVDAWHGDDELAVVDWRPDAPRWFRERRIRTAVTFLRGDSCDIVSRRIER